MVRDKPRGKTRVLAHCPLSSECGSSGNIGEIKGGEERNQSPYLT